jgi:ethanolamine utilization protein EutA (predicted chaperonin)
VDGIPRTVLNVDLGASTTKFALCRGGDVLETAALVISPVKRGREVV